MYTCCVCTCHVAHHYYSYYFSMLCLSKTSLRMQCFQYALCPMFYHLLSEVLIIGTHSLNYLSLQVMGVISMAIGLWIYVTKNEFATFSEGKDLLGSSFLVAVGFGIIIIGFLGIVAAVWESIIMASVVSIAPCVSNIAVTKVAMMLESHDRRVKIQANL